MRMSELEAMLRETLEDGRLSRGEKGALRAVIDDEGLGADRLAAVRSKAFVIARESVVDPRARDVIGWLEDLVKLLSPTVPSATFAEAYFSPGEACLQAILGELGRARRTADLCVFTVTDDRITRAVLDAHRRSVVVRVLTDDDKSADLGSDIERLRQAGVEVRTDRTEHHMHHKFALTDGVRLLNGSFNWTRSASAHNEENVVVTDDPRLVRAFAAQFEALWAPLAQGR